MFDPFELRGEFFEGLTAIDAAIVERVAKEACGDCGGPLYRSDFPRKPRVGLLAAAVEALSRRFSLCCGRDGCRRRVTPPSVRFLGRRVYVGVIVILVSAYALAAVTASAVVRKTGAPDRRQLPASLLERLGGDGAAPLAKLMTWLAPITTTSCPDGSRFVRGAM